jgi:hypothetical protein
MDFSAARLEHLQNRTKWLTAGTLSGLHPENIRGFYLNCSRVDNTVIQCFSVVTVTGMDRPSAQTCW